MKIQPLWLDGPLQGTDYEIDYPVMFGGYQAIWPDPRETVQDMVEETDPLDRVHTYHFHKYAICNHIFILASQYSETEYMQYSTEYRDRLLDMLLNDRARKAEYQRMSL